MIVVTHQREKCIGCNYCEEVASYRWRMSKKDGKANLVGAKERKGFYTLRAHEHEFEDHVKAAESCPVKIIHVKKV
jgi:ferredoxin